MSPLVYKFGGTSVGSAKRIRQVAKIIEDAPLPVAVVVSAMSGVTDRLVSLVNESRRGNKGGIDTHLEAIRQLHREAWVDLEGASDSWEAIESVLLQLHAILRAASTLGELSARTQDMVLSMGEKMSIHLVTHALVRRGVKAQAMCADEFLATDAVFSNASPLGPLTDHAVKIALMPVLSAGVTPVVTGFCGRSPSGETTTLGRGGSDLSASILGAALGAQEVVLWSDVPGVFTTDPRVVPEARVIPHLNYREAAEMSFYGAKVLHQRTMIPVARFNIPVRCRSTLEPVAKGTLIDDRFSAGSHPVKACSTVAQQALISVEGKGMAGVPGVAGRIFGALATADISVTMICQSSSEASIAFVVPTSAANQAVTTVKECLDLELSRGDVEDVYARQGIALIAVVGLGMAATPGIAARVFNALARAEVNVYAIAQGASELNISVAIDADSSGLAVRALHAEFQLDRIDTGVDTGRHFDLILLGCGQIAHRLISILRERACHIRERFCLLPRVVALADRSGFILNPTGLSGERIGEILQGKAQGVSLVEQSGVRGNLSQMLDATMAYRLARPVVVDLTDEKDNGALLIRALELGADVVTANKGPLADSANTFDILMNRRVSGRLTRGEATVGAGLPVLDTLDMLVASGDTLIQVEGCLSGTLGFICDSLDQGGLLSDAVHEAASLGYTEPDPAIDLSGLDVARKAKIIARMAGWQVDDHLVNVSGIVPHDWVGLTQDVLISKIKSLDNEVAQRVREAKADGGGLRYVATITAQSIDISLKNVSRESPILGLRGTDNMVVFSTERYHDRPLVVMGPGAGAEVTAMGVFSDILRIAAERAPNHG